MRRSKLIRAAAALTLGGTTTLAVAWICSLLVSHTRPAMSNLRLCDQINPDGQSARMFDVAVLRCPGVLCCTWNDAGRFPSSMIGPGFTPIGPSEVPSWSSLRRLDNRDLPKRDDAPFFREIEWRAGWPMLALHGTMHPDDFLPYRPGWQTYGGVLRHRDDVPRIRVNWNLSLAGHLVPVIPLWPGFLADTALFALLWSPIVFAGPVRRALRRRRGLCERCTYDRKGLAPGAPCPECGHATA